MAVDRPHRTVLPRIVAAVERQATLGEIADTLRRVFGEQREDQALYYDC